SVRAGGAGSGRHPAAGFGTAPAHLGAAPHLVVIAEAPAILGTALADLSAGGADVPVQVGPSDHEIGAGPADLGAVDQQPDMPRLGVPAALVQAMRNRLQADAVTIGAVANALLDIHGV